METRILFCFWMGENPMSEQRKQALHSLRVNSECMVTLITAENLKKWIKPNASLHPAFEYLSAVHKADYLRAYFMHHYGGAYSDIKPISSSLRTAFQSLNHPDYWIVGYGESSPTDIAHIEDKRVRSILQSAYSQILGVCQYVSKPNTMFTREWLEQIHIVLDKYHSKLEEYPAPYPRAMREEIPSYALSWTEIGGQIFHPLCYKYRQHICIALTAPKCEMYM